MFDIVGNAFSYERELICLLISDGFLQGKGSSLQLISNAHSAFLLVGHSYWQKGTGGGGGGRRKELIFKT